MHGKGVISSAKETSFITRKASLGSDISLLPGSHNRPLTADDSVPHLSQPKQAPARRGRKVIIAISCSLAGANLAQGAVKLHYHLSCGVEKQGVLTQWRTQCLYLQNHHTEEGFLAVAAY